MLPSPVDSVTFRGKKFHVKRDDLIDTCLSGNKYRKLYTLLQTPSSKYTKVISYGGAQSNAMYSLSCLCKKKGWEFHYYTKTLPQFLKDGVEGNLELALANDMKLYEVDHVDFNAKVQELTDNDEKRVLLVSQGAADALAKEGIILLAQEINTWKEEQGLSHLNVVLPSGTGTTALYLKEGLDKEVDLYTSVLVGDVAYQRLQWEKLSSGPYPHVFEQEQKKKFAKPYPEYLEMHEELRKATDIEFDLIYAPRTWIQMLENFNEVDGNILYIHTGGVSGNETMLQRYAHMKRVKR